MRPILQSRATTYGSVAIAVVGIRNDRSGGIEIRIKRASSTAYQWNSGRDSRGRTRARCCKSTHATDVKHPSAIRADMLTQVVANACKIKVGFTPSPAMRNRSKTLSSYNIFDGLKSK